MKKSVFVDPPAKPLYYAFSLFSDATLVDTTLTLLSAVHTVNKKRELEAIPLKKNNFLEEKDKSSER
jgi:hypothetical protein